MKQLLYHQNTKLATIVLIALVIRLAGIVSRPIWYDEAFSVLLSDSGPAAILQGTLSTPETSKAAEEHPPFYYFLLWIWFEAVGRSIPSARVLSVIASIGVLLINYKIALHLFNSQVAETAALATAILPFQVHYGQEIRMYALLCLCLSFTTYFFLKRKWALFSICAAAAQYTHNLAFVFLVPLALSSLYEMDWKLIRAVIISGIASIILYIPWLVYLPNQFSKISDGYWLLKPGVEKFFTLIVIFITGLPVPPTLLFPSLFISLLLIFIGVNLTFKTGFIDNNFKKSLRWLAFISFTPAFFLWGISQSIPVYIERALLPSYAMFCIWLASSYQVTKSPKLITFLASSLVGLAALIGIIEHVTYHGFPYAPFSQLTTSITSRLQPGDVVLHANKNSFLPSLYYAPFLRQSFVADPPNSGMDTLAPATQAKLGIKEAATIESATFDAYRVWFIVFKTHIDRYIELGYPNHPHLTFLEEHYHLESSENWGDLRIFLFSNPKDINH